MSPKEAETLLEDTAAKLAEHFGAIQILASWVEEGATHYSKRGSGNWYARQGMAHEFITSDISEDAAVRIAEKMKETYE